jgi:hypothetical protein
VAFILMQLCRKPVLHYGGTTHAVPTLMIRSLQDPVTTSSRLATRSPVLPRLALHSLPSTRLAKQLCLAQCTWCK